MAGGLLHAAGLDELIATSWESYEGLVVELVNDPARRTAIRERMRALSDEWRGAPARLVRSLEHELAARLPQVSTNQAR